MKKLTRKTLDELAKEMPVLNESQKRCFIGGGKDSCVFNCFDYLDGNLYDVSHYYEYTLKRLGYAPGPNGEVHTSDIGIIGSYGGFDVSELTSSFSLSSNGCTNGGNIIMTFNDNGIDHAVVVTGYGYDEKGNLTLKYYDPTFKTNGFKTMGDYSALYRVGTLLIDSPISSGTTSDSGIYYT